eukprot:TRINITY_DN33_c1_g2_i1.p3 TRINITY_DN33_c1_g2~~TRINITY_DN33_c1_g2_i1.p3  ORF type:complete len:193 (-),score=1.39 TRINITY_DN33_c1_g2_i1:175-753(-)
MTTPVAGEQHMSEQFSYPDQPIALRSLDQFEMDDKRSDIFESIQVEEGCVKICLCSSQESRELGLCVDSCVILGPVLRGEHLRQLTTYTEYCHIAIVNSSLRRNIIIIIIFCPTIIIKIFRFFNDEEYAETCGVIIILGILKKLYLTQSFWSDMKNNKRFRVSQLGLWLYDDGYSFAVKFQVRYEFNKDGFG